MLLRVSKWWTGVTMLAALLAAGCSNERGVETIVEPQFARGGGPSVEAADPPEAPQDVTLDVQIIGSGFEDGSQVTFLLAGESTPKILTNSSTFVDSNTLVANITIAPDADLAFYDIQVMSIRGKKGIGSELFAVKQGSGGGGNGGPGGEPSAYTLTIVESACPPTCENLEVLSGISSTGLIVGDVGREPTVWDASLTGYPLGRLGGEEAYPYSISPAGTDVVGESWLSGIQRPASWTLSGTTVASSRILPLLPGYVAGLAKDANDVGQIVGYLYDSPNDHAVGVLWESYGIPRELGSLAGYDRAWPEAINSTGHVAGWFSSGTLSRAVLWIVGGSSVALVELTPSGADWARAYDVTEVTGGVISVAGISGAGGVTSRTVWTVDAQTGSILDVTYDATSTYGTIGINANLEFLAGMEVWDVGSGAIETLPVLNDRCSGGGRSINDAGVIVGTVGDRYRGSCINRLAIWTPVAP